MTRSPTGDLDHPSESELSAKLEADLLPKHVAVIMDGNGRWAELRGLLALPAIVKASTPSER